MFYLLEDNRIIDSKKTKYFDLCTRFGFLLEIDGETIIQNIGKIKKQSENVFDLIEVGDLLFLPFYCGDMLISRFDTFKRYEYNLFHCWIHTVREKEIYAIYKPNSNGDYIKVWEAKNE